MTRRHAIALSILRLVNRRLQQARCLAGSVFVLRCDADGVTDASLASSRPGHALPCSIPHVPAEAMLSQWLEGAKDTALDSEDCGGRSMSTQ